MPLVVKNTVKQEKVEKPTEKSSSFAEIRQKALQQSNIPQTNSIVKKVATIDPKTSKELDEAAKEAERLRSEILELKRARQSLQQAKESEREVGVALVVDGERKKVSKTSKYLLDMLTLDDQ
jgi:hypothetical protein